MSKLARFSFKEDENRETVEADIALAIFTAECVYGRPRVRMETSYLVDEGGKTCVVEVCGEAGETAARVFAGLVAARRLGWKTVPVIFLDLSPEQARLLNLALNKISGQWDQELLARMLADLKPIEDIDLSLSGFSEEELGKLLKSLEARDKRDRPESFDLEAALEATRADPGVDRGDIWLLGENRVMCGDAADSADVSRLVAAQRASMAFTDPPYGVDLGHHGGAPRTGRRRTIANDALPPAEWEAFRRRWAQNVLGHVDGALYICMSTREWPVVSRVLEEAGGH